MLDFVFGNLKMIIDEFTQKSSYCCRNESLFLAEVTRLLENVTSIHWDAFLFWHRLLLDPIRYSPSLQAPTLCGIPPVENIFPSDTGYWAHL